MFQNTHHSLPMSTAEEEKVEEKVAGKKAENAPPVNIGWDSHKAVVSRFEGSALSRFSVADFRSDTIIDYFIFPLLFFPFTKRLR